MTEPVWATVCVQFKQGWLPELPDETDGGDGGGDGGDGEPVCVDTAPEGAFDKYGDNCSDYDAHPGWCSDNSQTADFDQTTMCCACDGGETIDGGDGGGDGGSDEKTPLEKF